MNGVAIGDSKCTTCNDACALCDSDDTSDYCHSNVANSDGNYENVCPETETDCTCQARDLVINVPQIKK